MLSRRIGLLTDPLGVTGFMCGPLWDLTGFITVSSFQGSGAARGYVTGLYPRCQSLLLTDFGESLKSHGQEKCLRFGGVGWADDRHVLATSRYPNDLVHVLLLKIRAPLSRRRLGYSITAPAGTQAIIGDWLKVVPPTPCRSSRNERPTLVRAREQTAACLPAGHGQPPHPTRHRTFRGQRARPRFADLHHRLGALHQRSHSPIPWF